MLSKRTQRQAERNCSACRHPPISRGRRTHVANPLKMLKLKPTGFQFIQELKVNASAKRTWDALLKVEGWFTFNSSMSNKGRKLEVWPGGRFFNTLPDGTQMYYGIVTHIEPGKLLRLNGPMGNTHMPCLLYTSPSPRDS